MNIYFNYGDVENSYLFLFSGIVSVIVFIFLSIITRKISDRNLISIGIIIHLIAYIWGAIIFPTFRTGKVEFY